MVSIYPRGSEWSKWDLHIHSPASFHWTGTEKLHRLDHAARVVVLREMVTALNSADASVFAIMDYWTFDGVLALREHCRSFPNQLQKTVFPGIELRVQAPTTKRLDIHAIFSEEIPDQRLRDFLACLRVQLMDGRELPLSRVCLIEYARALRDDQLAPHGFKRDHLVDDEYAWDVGCKTCEVTQESFREAMKQAPDGMAIIYQPWDTYHGLIDVEWRNHYTAAYRLFTQPDIFESKGAEYRAAFLGKETPANAKFFKGFWTALEGRPRLAVRGSDAHEFDNYGVFQSNLTTWIKAAPTFRGLLQAIKEPEQRSWLGSEPPKREKRRSKPTVFIDRIALRKTADHTLSHEDWFDGQSLPLNPDLVAVIGSKGSGKSALADIIGLLGDTANVVSFSFLNYNRFRDRKNNRSLHFEAELTWADNKNSIKRLSENTKPGAIERVRYIPQEYFEKVCAGHTETDIAEFTGQIERVIFSYVPSDLRGDSADLQDLLRQQEDEAYRNLDRLRTEVRRLNDNICDIRRRSTAEVRAEFEAQLGLRQTQLEDLQHAKPPMPPEVDVDKGLLDPNLVKIQALEAQKVELNTDVYSAQLQLNDLQQKGKAAARLLSGVRNLETTISESIERMRSDAQSLDLDITHIVKIQIDSQGVVEKQQAISSQVDSQQEQISGSSSDSLVSQIAKIDAEINAVKAGLDAKQIEQQSARERYAKWESNVAALTGVKEQPTSIAYIQAQIEWIDHAHELIARLELERLERTKEIATQLISVKDSRESLVAKAKQTIETVIPKQQDFSLGFVNELVVAELEERFFEHIKQVSGTFRGEDEGRRAFRELVEAIPLTSVDEIASVAQKLEQAVISDLRDGKIEHINIDSQVRKGRSAEEFLSLLYGLEYIRPRFTLALAGQPLTQLSPGQRGALLLVFYLLVEDSDLPIVLDQPEENLDNETVFALLVQIIKKAKVRRQIIMVTHNANLAVCCDAEQIIHASLDKANRSKVTYTCGPIEDPAINKLVVDVLEGTRPAFNNRKVKYELAGNGGA